MTMQRLNVLIADDSDDDRFLFCRALQKTGFDLQIVEVEDGAEAIEFLTRQKRFANAHLPSPDIIFLDLKMPAQSGFEVLAWIREHLPNAPFKIVVLSGSELNVDVERAVQMGAATYLVKPVDVQALRQLLESAAAPQPDLRT